jgi:hypothetical protein
LYAVPAGIVRNGPSGNAQVCFINDLINLWN